MLYEKMMRAQDEKDIDSFLELLHDEFRMVSHQLGIERDKAAFSEMAAQMMASTALSFDRQRCLYENDNILVEHSFMTLPDGSREAVMAVWTKLEGKLLQVETGATPISN